MTTPRAYTAEEIRDKFLRHVWESIEYWDKTKPNKREAMEGLAFSILVSLDGGVLDLPGFMVIPTPHEDDKEYCIEHGDNWFPPFVLGEEPCDIAGGLHEHFHQAQPQRSEPMTSTIDRTKLRSNNTFPNRTFLVAFNTMAAEHHAVMVSKGFWDISDAETTTMDTVRLMLMVTELAEACEAIRHGNPPDDKVPEFSGLEAELADCVLRIMDMAQGRGLRVAEAIVAKLEYNKSRPDKHGKTF
jgi:NTP pyrophosphatase (non-canonical NTP hydrolase)